MCPPTASGAGVNFVESNAHASTMDDPTTQRLELASDRLDLGKLGHGRSVPYRWRSIEPRPDTGAGERRTSRRHRPSKSDERARRRREQGAASMAASGGKKAILAAFFANLGICVAKLIGFAITGASSMLSEAIHSAADTGNQGLLLLGSSRARREADEEHPFGYGRERYFWAFVVAVVLFTLGSVFAIYEGIHKIQHPEAVVSPAVALAILGVAIVLESFSFRTAVDRVEPRPRRPRAGGGSCARRRSPSSRSCCSRTSARWSVSWSRSARSSISAVTDNGVYDGIGSVIIGGILGVIAIFLCIEMKSLLIGESATPEDRAAIDGRPARLRPGRTPDPRAHRAPRARGDPARRQGRVPRPTWTSPTSPRRSTRSRRRSAPAVPAVKLVYIEPAIYEPGPA